MGNCFERGYDEIVHIPMSSGLSGACQNAVQLAAEYGGKVYFLLYPSITPIK